MEGRLASCRCQKLRLRCDGQPSKVSMCHCLDCQRRTGSAFSVAVFYDRSNVRIEQGETKAFARHSSSNFPVTFHFCDGFLGARASSRSYRRCHRCLR